MTVAPPIRRPEFLEAEQIAKILPTLLTKRNLLPAISKYYLTNDLGMTLLIAVLDPTHISDHSRYIQKDLLHQLATDLGGRKVFLSNSTGIRYVIPISTLPKLPRSIELPIDIPSNVVALGMMFNGRSIQIPWSKLGHLLIVGMTGSGKSSLLRSMVYQGSMDGLLLALADIDQTTFPMLENHPNLFAPIATTPQDALDLIQKVLGEMDRRADLFKRMSGYPENIDEYNSNAIKTSVEPLKRMLMLLDEASSVLRAMGGASGQMAGKLAELGWRGRKFGIHFIYGAQDFSKELVGAVREQVNLTVAFRVRPTSAQMAKRIGCDGAHRIRADRPGLAIVDRFGPMQAFYVPKPMMLSAGTISLNTLSDIEQRLFSQALSAADGRLTITNIAEWGECSQHKARKLQEAWALQGWITKDGNRDNSFYLTAKARDLLTNQQTAQTTTNRRKPTQTQ